MKPASMKLYPLFADLRGRDVLVVGGGDVAARKCRALLDAGAVVTIGAPELNEALSKLRGAGAIRHVAGRFDYSWLDGVWLVVTATDDARVNRRVAAAATRRRILINVVDDGSLSSFHVPAIVDRSPLQIAISSGGAAPMLARSLRERLEILLDHALGPMASLLERTRSAIRARYREPFARRSFYQRIFDGRVLSLLRSGMADQAEKELARELAGARPASTGSVILVGAGPGDPGLLTLRALRALNEADVILHDRLVSAEVLDLARRDAVRVDVGKEAGNHPVTQERINALMLHHARAGRRVVRLKGGDPFVFGRGGEELEYLRERNVPYEVVPGITAALACAAYAGIPLTHRDHAQSVQFLTAHSAQTLDALDAPSLGQQRQTLAIYMGASQLAQLRAKLIAAGRPEHTPVAIIENGTHGDQRVIVATLAELDDIGSRESIRSPALVVVGTVAALARDLAWFGSPPVDATLPLRADLAKVA